MKAVFGLGICLLFVVAVLGGVGVGCTGMAGHSTLDAISEQAGHQPYVEAFIEYAGPAEKWGGPVSLVLHVSAREGAAPEVTSTPPLHIVKGGGPTVEKNRVPASVKMTNEAAREQLGLLAMALGTGKQEFRGCMYPVKVRLIKADNSIVEKYGCRGQSGWARAASEVVSNFLAEASG